MKLSGLWSISSKRKWDKKWNKNEIKTAPVERPGQFWQVLLSFKNGHSLPQSRKVKTASVKARLSPGILRGPDSAGYDLYTEGGKLGDGLFFYFLICDDGFNPVFEVERYSAVPGKLLGLCQDNDPVSLPRHIPYGLGPHLVLMGEARSCGPAVHTDEKTVHPEILDTLPHHGAVSSAEKSSGTGKSIFSTSLRNITKSTGCRCRRSLLMYAGTPTAARKPRRA